MARRYADKEAASTSVVVARDHMAHPGAGCSGSGNHLRRSRPSFPMAASQRRGRVAVSEVCVADVWLRCDDCRCCRCCCWVGGAACTVLTSPPPRDDSSFWSGFVRAFTAETTGTAMALVLAGSDVEPDVLAMDVRGPTVAWHAVERAVQPGSATSAWAAPSGAPLSESVAGPGPAQATWPAATAHLAVLARALTRRVDDGVAVLSALSSSVLPATVAHLHVACTYTLTSAHVCVYSRSTGDRGRSQRRLQLRILREDAARTASKISADAGENPAAPTGRSGPSWPTVFVPLLTVPTSTVVRFCSAHKAIWGASPVMC